MGGAGSGNWFRWGPKKLTVEESLTLRIRDFQGRLHPNSAGTLTWTWAKGNQSSVGYWVNWDADVPMLTLSYRLRDEVDVRIPILLQRTRTNFGGRRWWFTCPLVAHGLSCNRRVGCLYLPPGARYFGCRHCHDLTYQSSQEAHRWERVAIMFGYDPEVVRLLDSRVRAKRAGQSRAGRSRDGNCGTPGQR